MRLNRFFCNPVTVDVVSGLVRWGPEPMVSRWQVVQQGDNTNDWVLKRELDDEQTERRDDAVVRIRSGAEGWRGVPVIFRSC